VTDLAAGDRHLCLRTSDGHATCLGSNRFGELSGGAPYAAGTRQVPLTPISSIAVDRTQTCAVTETGEVFCWGDDLSTTWNPDRQGMRADPRAAPWANRLSAPMRMRGVPEATHVLAGFRRACVVGAEGDLWCWGRPYGVEFREPSVPQRAPTHIASDVVTADAHRDSGCMMNRAGEIACWGPIAMCPTCLSEYLVVPPGVVLASVTPTGSLTVRHGQYD
jgi:alpha-tubulin suppressor-like RCC1 family protein